MRGSFRAAVVAGLTAAALPLPGAMAADADGNYALRGAGRTTCADFLAARAEGGAGYAVYVGYVDGYLTAFNHREPDTFDIAPWQTTELIAAGLARLCDGQPDATFDAALNRAVRALHDDRLRAQDRLVSVRVGGRAVFLYETTLARIRKRLAAQGFSPGDGMFDAQTEAALRLFQARNGLAVTGMPDQRTLARLFAAPAP